MLILNDQGGERMDITEDVVTTLRAEAHHPPLVLAAGFKAQPSAKARTIAYQENVSPSLSAGCFDASVFLKYGEVDL